MCLRLIVSLTIYFVALCAIASDSIVTLPEKNAPMADIIEFVKANAPDCSAQLNQDTFLKEFCSYSTGDRSPLAV